MPRFSSPVVVVSAPARGSTTTRPNVYANAPIDKTVARWPGSSRRFRNAVVRAGWRLHTMYRGTWSNAEPGNCPAPYMPKNAADAVRTAKGARRLNRSGIRVGARKGGWPPTPTPPKPAAAATPPARVGGELDHRVPSDVPRELRLVARLEQRLVQVCGGPDRERRTEGPDDVRGDVAPEGRAEAVAQDSRGAEQLAQDDRPPPGRAVRDDAAGKLEYQKSDPEGDVDEGEVEIGREVAADPQRPERDPDRERRGGLVRVEATDARPQIGG